MSFTSKHHERSLEESGAASATMGGYIDGACGSVQILTIGDLDI